MRGVEDNVLGVDNSVSGVDDRVASVDATHAKVVAVDKIAHWQDRRASNYRVFGSD